VARKIVSQEADEKRKKDDGRVDSAPYEVTATQRGAGGSWEDIAHQG
jgi:hypothetical protein